MNHSKHRASWGSAASETVERLVLVLGHDVAIKVVEHFAGERIPATRHLSQLLDHTLPSGKRKVSNE